MSIQEENQLFKIFALLRFFRFSVKMKTKLFLFIFSVVCYGSQTLNFLSSFLVFIFFVSFCFFFYVFTDIFFSYWSQTNCSILNCLKTEGNVWQAFSWPSCDIEQLKIDSIWHLLNWNFLGILEKREIEQIN